MQIGYLLVAVIGLYPRRGEALSQLRHLVLQIRTGRHVAQRPHIHRRGPLRPGPIFLGHVRVDHLADAIRQSADHDNEDSQRRQKDQNSGNTHVGALIARGCVDLFRPVTFWLLPQTLTRLRLRFVIVMRLHAQAPESPPIADRWFAPADASSNASRSKQPRRLSLPPAQPHIQEFPN